MGNKKELTKEEVKQLRDKAIRQATAEAFLYFTLCDVGPERTQAHAVFTNLHDSTRVRSNLEH